MKTCSIDGCGGRVIARTWCSNHYRRWKAHGDPLAGRTPWGVPLKWLDDHSTYDGEECLAFPFARNDAGYGSMLFRGKIMGAHRAMCFLAHGNPPTDQHVAAHSCGMGHLGCVNPKHLRWATQQENLDDLIEHREAGIARPTLSGLTDAQCREIIGMKGREFMRVTGQRYGITESMVCRIQKGNRRVGAQKGLA